MLVTTTYCGDKNYELTNHLGNVLSVVTDKKIPTFTNSSLNYFNADVVTYNDYFPFGMLLPNRHGNSSDYRYGFQGQEKDDEIKGEGNSYNFKYRMHDPRVGRFFAIDPLTAEYPHYTPYSFSGNKVIAFRELEGLEQKYYLLYLNDGKPAIEELKDKETDRWLWPDTKTVGIVELEIAFSFSKKLHPFAQQELNNPYDRFEEFVEDPIGSILSGEFRSNESIVTNTVEDIIITLAMRRMARLPKGTNKKALPGATGNKMPAWLKRVREGIAFQQKKLAELTAQKVKYAGNVRLVPKNGKGNVKGNRTDTDALILNEDGVTYTIKEYKLTSTTPLTKGQRATKKQVESGNGDFEVRSDVNINGVQLKKGQKIKVTKFEVEVKEKG